MARRAPLCSPVAQLSGSAFCGKRTTPPFCRSFCRFPQTPSCSKALGPVALRAPHPLPRSPRLRGERGWERPPSILRMDGPETGGFCRPSCRFRGRSQPAPTARVIPAGRQLRDDGATRAPALVEFLEDPAHAPHHPPHRGPRRALPHAPLRRVPRARRYADPGLQRATACPVHRLRRVLVPPRARIGMMSPITTRGLPHDDRHIPARPNAYRRYVTVRSSRYRARPGSERLAPTAHLALHGQRVVHLPEQRRGVGQRGRERLPRCLRPQRGPHGGRRITGRRLGPPGDGRLAFPQGSIAPQARAGSDPEHDGSGDGRSRFRGCRSVDRRGVAPSPTLRPEAESAVREYASEP